MFTKNGYKIVSEGPIDMDLVAWQKKAPVEQNQNKALLE